MKHVLRSTSSNFCATGIFTDVFIDFCFTIFTKVSTKALARMVIHVRKIRNCSSYQVTFRMPFSKRITITVIGFVLKYPFLPLVLKKNKYINTRNIVAFSYHLKVRSAQNRGVIFLFCSEHGIQYYFPTFG